MSGPIIDDLKRLSDLLQLTRCQVDVSFPPGYKAASQPHCPWYIECHGRPQIIEVKDTGWETYHFHTIGDAERFVELTKQQVESGGFAGGRLPNGSEVQVQLRAAVEIARVVIARLESRAD